MKRRVNLIAGVLAQSSILFSTNPPLALDVHSPKRDHPAPEGDQCLGTTIIYTSHHMEEAETFCTRVSIVTMGKDPHQKEPAETLINKHPGAPYLGTVFLNLTKRKLGLMLHKLPATVKKKELLLLRDKVGSSIDSLHHAHGIDICDDPGSRIGF